jgi:hypothetical protein
MLGVLGSAIARAKSFARARCRCVHCEPLHSANAVMRFDGEMVDYIVACRCISRDIAVLIVHIVLV